MFTSRFLLISPIIVRLLVSCNKSKGSFIGRVSIQYLNSHNQCSNMYSTIIYGKGRNESFIKVREIRGQKQNGAQEDKYRQRTPSHKKLNKNIEQQHRPLQKLGELGCFKKVSSSCFLYNTHHVHDVVHHQRHVYRIQWFPFKRF